MIDTDWPDGEPYAPLKKIYVAAQAVSAQAYVHCGSDLLARCKNCSHWKWWTGFEERNSSFKERPCAMAVEGDSEGDSDDRAMVFNGIDSFMVTGPNFGCIHFSPLNK